MKRVFTDLGMRWLLFVLFVPSVSAALISGSIYDADLSLIEQSVLTINTSPEQVLVILDGTYALEVGEGSYAIIVEGGQLEERTMITISEEGTYVRDFILFPDIDLPDVGSEPAFGLDADQVLYAGEEPGRGEPSTESDNKPSDTDNLLPWIAISVGILLLLAIVLLIRRKAHRRASNGSFDRFEHAVIEALIKRGGRATQKEIRSELPFSEAKASLVIADLASRGIVRKFKRGRGNIIVLEHGKANETRKEAT